MRDPFAFGQADELAQLERAVGGGLGAVQVTGVQLTVQDGDGFAFQAFCQAGEDVFGGDEATVDRDLGHQACAVDLEAVAGQPSGR